jgi:hypothetical protein
VELELLVKEMLAVMVLGIIKALAAAAVLAVLVQIILVPLLEQQV